MNAGRPTSTVSWKTLGARLAQRGWRWVMMRALLFAAGWWVISEGDPSALLFGLPVVLLALGASVLLPSPPAPSWKVAGLARYALSFLIDSLHGGVDVARRALAPRLSLRPALFRYRLRLSTPPARHLFMGTLSLLPGSLSVALEGDDLEVHVLVDQPEAQLRRLHRLEANVAHALGEPWEVPDA